MDQDWAIMGGEFAWDPNRKGSIMTSFESGKKKWYGVLNQSILTIRHTCTTIDLLHRHRDASRKLVVEVENHFKLFTKITSFPTITRS